MELVSLTSSTPLALALALAFLSTARRCDGVSESIIGSRETCDVEGEDFTVDKIPNTRCFNCICKNGFVECLKHQCPSTEGCYTLLESRDDECCHRCKVPSDYDGRTIGLRGKSGLTPRSSFPEERTFIGTGMTASCLILVVLSNISKSIINHLRAAMPSFAEESAGLALPLPPPLLDHPHSM